MVLFYVELLISEPCFNSPSASKVWPVDYEKPAPAKVTLAGGYRLYKISSH